MPPCPLGLGLSLSPGLSLQSVKSSKNSKIKTFEEPKESGGSKGLKNSGMKGLREFGASAPAPTLAFA